jgi:hypothetical protein
MRFVFEVAGEKQINRDLLRVGERAADMRPAFAAIVDFWRSETQLQFASQGGHASGGWKPLKPSTVAEKARRHLRPEILRATDGLFSSLTQKGDPNELLEMTASEVDWGSRLPYARYHQTGTSKMPRRRPIEFTETTRRNTIKILQRHLLAGGMR